MKPDTNGDEKYPTPTTSAPPPAVACNYLDKGNLPGGNPAKTTNNL